MTTPPVPTFDFSTVIPDKYKAWVGLVGAILTFVGPTILEVTTNAPQPWPIVVAGFFAVLTWLGIYRAPYTPKDSVLVNKTELKQAVQTVIAHDGGVEVQLPPTPAGRPGEVITPTPPQTTNPYPPAWQNPRGTE